VTARQIIHNTVVGRCALGVFSVLVASILAIGSTSSLAQAGPLSGPVLITRPGTLTPLTGGGSGTEFSVVLPAGASCPGDTMHDGYLVYSYLVPKGVSPTAVNFKTGIPDRYYGFIAEGAYFGAVNTAAETGEIVTLPPEFAISRWGSSDLLARGASTATWDGGIACATAGGVVTTYWNTEFVIRADPSDPRGYAWRVVQTTAAAGGDGLGLGLGVALIVVALGSGVTALIWNRRRRGHPGGDPTASAPAGSDARVPQPTGGR
jgi:hypothetical protein